MTENNRTKGGTARIWIGGLIIVGIAGMSLFFISNKDDKKTNKETAGLLKAENAGPVVKVVKAGFDKPNNDISLIGEADPYASVTLYAKASGYMDKILVDKGQKVHEGQLLATLITPEIDQQYAAAVADLQNKKKILARDKALLPKQYIAVQDEEQAETDVATAEANVQSLNEQMQYKKITAPFDGTITARFIDPGSLVQNATSSQTSAQPVVTVANLDKIRLYVYVEQRDAAYLKPGYPVTIGMAEKPDLKIDASITRIAGELDPKTRMMLVEIDIDNRNNQIIPGSYVNVRIKHPSSSYIQIPTDALVVNGKQYLVPIVKQDSSIHLQPVVLGQNDGISVSILNGVNQGDLVALNLGQSLNEGQKVRVKM